MPLEFPTIELNESQSSVATLPATDPSGTETTSLRTRYTIGDPVTPATIPAPAQRDAQNGEPYHHCHLRPESR